MTGQQPNLDQHTQKRSQLHPLTCWLCRASHSEGHFPPPPLFLSSSLPLLLSSSPCFFHLSCLTALPRSESFRFLPGGSNLVWTTGRFKLMNSFYWTWINLRIEISQLLLSDDLSPPEDVLSIKKKQKKTAPKGNKSVRSFHWKGWGGRAGSVICVQWNKCTCIWEYQNIMDIPENLVTVLLQSSKCFLKSLS